MKLREVRERTAQAKDSGPRAGSALFGMRAGARRERLTRREKEGDLRVRTAHATAKEMRDMKNRIVAGD